MRRRKFILLTGIFILLISGYAGWCARKFLIHPAIERGSDIPDGAWTAIQQHFAGKGFPPPRFTWQDYADLLMHPYESNTTPAKTHRIGTEEVWVVHEGRALAFYKPEGRWIALIMPDFTHASKP